MWLDLTHIYLGFIIMSNVSFAIFTTYLSKVKCQLYHIYMHVNINLAFIYTYLHKEVNLTFLPVEIAEHRETRPEIRHHSAY